MSQEKVDRYKMEKANRQQIMKKEKIATRLKIFVGVAVVVVLVGWFSVAVYKQQAAKAVAEADSVITEVDLSAYDSFVSDIQTTYSDTDAE